MGVEPKIGGKPPQIMNFNRLFHEINKPSIFGCFPLFFGSTSICQNIFRPIARWVVEMVSSSSCRFVADPPYESDIPFKFVDSHFEDPSQKVGPWDRYKVGLWGPYKIYI